LVSQGCRAAGYRLAGADLDHVCCRHLYADDRMLTAWPAPDHAIVLAIGPHNRSNTDVYGLLLAAQDLKLRDDERTKPPCCDAAGEPPADSDAATAIIEALDGLARRRQRQRGSTRNSLRV